MSCPSVGSSNVLLKNRRRRDDRFQIGPRLAQLSEVRPWAGKSGGALERLRLELSPP